jgi:hypothetical protein
MRKSGLHKQISSIFDGVPVPPNSALSEEAEVLEELMEPAALNAPEADVTQETLPKTSGSSLVKRLTADPSEPECNPLPAVQVGRPMPTSKPIKVSKSAMKPGFSKQIKKAVFGAHSSLDPRQKKAGVLVGILSLVFGVVLFVSLGGVGKTQAMAADGTNADQATQVQAAKKTAQEWKRPEALPQDLRNATSPSMMRSDNNPTDLTTEAGGLIVKGIVFSKNKPSAIINNQILSEGQTFDGVTIVKINKESVEFEAHEKRWTQTVQR